MKLLFIHILSKLTSPLLVIFCAKKVSCFLFKTSQLAFCFLMVVFFIQKSNSQTITAPVPYTIDTQLNQKIAQTNDTSVLGLYAKNAIVSVIDGTIISTFYKAYPVKTKTIKSTLFVTQGVCFSVSNDTFLNDNFSINKLETKDTAKKIVTQPVATNVCTTNYPFFPSLSNYFSGEILFLISSNSSTHTFFRVAALQNVSLQNTSRQVHYTTKIKKTAHKDTTKSFVTVNNINMRPPPVTA